MQKILTFDLLSYWHAGSGRGADALADTVVITDEYGLPYLPGKTVKGLVRDVMERAAAASIVSAAAVTAYFGSASAGLQESSSAEAADQNMDAATEWQDRQLEASRYKTKVGQLSFGSATLPERWRRWARGANEGERQGVVQELFTHVASTSMDADGVAQDHTLRVSQVTVPMQLKARVEGPDDGAWARDMKTALPLLRNLGTRRFRGYGRVSVSMEDL